MSATNTYQAQPRTKTGSKAATALRKSGQVPVTVSRPGKDSTLLQVDVKTANQIDAHVVHLAKLEVGGKPVTVLRGAIAKHPLSDQIQHIDVLEVDEKSMIKVDVAVAVDARNCAGVKAGGLVEQRLRRIKVACPVNAIPDEVTIDISDVELMQTVLVEKITLPKGVTLVTPGKNPLLSVVIPRGMAKAESEAAAADGAAPAAAAEGEKKDDKAAAGAKKDDKAAAPAKKK
jgi:large subunit ribosomal protein L25